MNKKTGIIVILLLLLTSTIELFPIQFAEANFIPEPTPEGIHINEAGEVEGTNLIQRSGSTYTFIGDIEGTISILCDEIVLNGAGHTLEGSGSGTGIFLQERNGVTVENLKMQNFQVGIKCTWYNYGTALVERDNTFSDNTLTNNTYGIYVNDWSSGNKLLGNTVSGNTYGICLDSCGNNLLRDNRMENNNYNFFVKGNSLSKSINDVDQSNTVNGAPIIYWVHESGKTVPENAGYVALVDCSDVTVKNLDLTNNGQGILLAGVTDSRITTNRITQSIHGIWIIESENNQLENNTIEGTTYEGTYILSSNHNQIVGNTFANGGLEGTQASQVSGLLGRASMRFLYSSSNQICNNHFVGNGEGITFHDSNYNIVSSNMFEKTQGSAMYLFQSEYNDISGNVFRENALGIHIWDSGNNTVSANIVSKNNMGILIDTGANNKILLNNITDNVGFGLQLKSISTLLGGCKNNVIHHNNFINNQPDGLDVSIPAVMGDPIHTNGDKPQVQWIPGLGNTWDDGSEGNYWSDYLTRYPNAEEIANTGIGNTPYLINENNIDKHPLTSPVEISTESSPSQQQQPPDNPTIRDTSVLLEIGAAVSVAVLLIAGLIVYIKKRSGRKG